MDDSYNKRLRQQVEECLRNAIEQLRNIKDVRFRAEAEAPLRMINQKLHEIDRIKTMKLEIFREIIQKSLIKIFKKWALENEADENFIRMLGSTSLFMNADSSEFLTSREHHRSPVDQLAVETDQRLALKYPRKKNDAPHNCNPCNKSHDNAEQSTSTLFKRRHEVFVPQPQPATYGEHKRMMQQLHLQEDARKQAMPETATDIRINQEVSKTKPNTPNATRSIHLINQENASKQDMPKAVKDIRNIVKNIDKTSNIPEQCIRTDQMSVPGVRMESRKLCNSIDSIGDNAQIDNRNDVRVLPETTNKIAHQQSESQYPAKNRERNGDTNDRVIALQSKSTKPHHKNKKIHNELHDLLSYTAEIFPKLSKRKSISAEEEHNMQLLKQFGITKTLQIILQPSDCEQIAQRTRSKSIDSTKYLENLEAAKPNVTGPSKISHRRESRSMELKKQLPTSTNSSGNKIKQTARKSVSKPQNNVKPKASSKNHASIKNVFKHVSKEEQKLVKSDTASKQRIRRSPSPPPAKRPRNIANLSTDIHALATTEQNSAKDSDEDDQFALLPNVILKQNPQPNNDLKVHCHSDYMEKCCLCSYDGELMVQHYVYNHPKKAVYISRLAPEQARLIRADPFGISGRKAVSRYGDQEIIVFRCHFCDLRLSESQDIWLDHISKHTGEYRYKCMLCPTFSRHPTDRVPHHALCTNPVMHLWHTYTFEDNHLYAYMCNKCNFVQVLLGNMIRHFHQDHSEPGSIEGRYTKFSLVNYNLQEEDTELPYGMVKLEPMSDDTNAPMEEIVKQEVEFTPAEDCLIPSTASLQDIVQEQRSPEVITIKKEILTNDNDQGETNTSEETTEARCEPQESREFSYSSSVLVKRLPGDTLSSKEDNSKPVCNSSFLKEYDIKYSTNNAGSRDTTNSTSVYSGTNQHHATSSMVALQPWNGKDGNKMLLHTSKLTDQFLIAPFKCTAFNCGFYTNTSQTMASHFQRHQKLTTVHPITRDSSWLECCYCNYVSLSVHNLLQHIETVHKYCAYQCDRCCYRSRDPNSVRVHQLNYHLAYDADAKIVWIPSRQKEYSSMDRDIIMNHLKINVNILQCTNCSSREFNDMEEYQNHMKAHGLIYIACHVCDLIVAANKMIDHISSHNIFMIQCIYCDYGINDVNTIMKHVVDEHSDELLCYHVRCSKNVPPFIRVQNRISPERFINCEQNF